MANDQATRFSLEEDLGISRAAAFHKQMLKIIDDNTGAVEFDGGAVERIDTACMQLLVSSFKALETRGRSVRWLSISDSLRRSAARLGLDIPLELNKAT